MLCSIKPVKENARQGKEMQELGSAVVFRCASVTAHFCTGVAVTLRCGVRALVDAPF